MPVIKTILAREILDSRGNPTVEVDMELESGVFARAAVPSGASTGAYEAHELRDGENRYFGKGVQKAIGHIRNEIAKAVVGVPLANFRELDQALIELDGSENKSNLGANALLGVSLAFAKACALENKQWLFESLSDGRELKLPVPLMNILNGGAHANNGLDVQEFMIAPVSGGSFKEALRIGSEVFHSLKKQLGKNGLSTAVGDEGGFAPKLGSNREALEVIEQSVKNAGYKLGEDVLLALDVASTELFKNGRYRWEGSEVTSDGLGDVYASWCESFPIASIEDAFAEDDWQGWINFTAAHGSSLQLVGDDLFVTNPKRLSEGIEKKAANALLVKVNQIGSLSETWDAIKMAKEARFKCVMSHRSGETEDVTIADLAVGLGCEQIKAGSLCRGERTAKYNQLLRIEERLGERAQYFGRGAFS